MTDATRLVALLWQIQPADISCLKGDPAQARSALGWSPRTPLPA